MKKGRLACAGLGLIVLAVLVVQSGWPAYVRAKEDRAMGRAWKCLDTGDWAGAALSARQVLQTSPRNAQACRMLADLAEVGRSSTAIDWRRRVSEFEPAVTNDLALAATALRFEHPPFALACQTLKKIAPAAGSSPAFHVLSALVDLKSQRPAEALDHFRTAARLEPSNTVYALNCAVTELLSSDKAIAGSARATVEKLCEQPRVQALALRSLVADCLRCEDYVRAEQFSERLLRAPVFKLEDHLVDLTIRQRMQSQLRGQSGADERNGPDNPSKTKSLSAAGTRVEVLAGNSFEQQLRSVQGHASSDPVEIHGVCEWMGAHGLAARGLHWLGTLDTNVCRLQPVPLARASLYAAAEDWESLGRFLGAERWGEMDFLRQALQARAAWGQRQEETGAARWRSAVHSAADRLGALVLLLRLSEEWNRSPEEVFWTIWHRFPLEHWAVGQLERLYIRAGNTRGLNRIYTARLEQATGSGDITNRNDFACTSLLLGIQLPRAHQVARELHTQNPNDLVIASTYAYSLQLQDKTNDALRVFSKFSPRELEQPGVALYYGVLLAKVGETQLAKSYLKCAERVRLSPEELQLLRTSQLACQ